MSAPAVSASSGKAMGIDLGSKRIGVALCDTARTLAFPADTVHRSGDSAADRRALVALAHEHGVGVIVIGLPLAMSGKHGSAARAALEEAHEVALLLEGSGIEIETFDERLTTVSANGALASAGKRGRSARRVVDQSAATVMLQAWMDAQ